MSKVNGKKVLAATAHGIVHTAKLGQIGPVLSTTDTGSKVKSMEIDEPFLVVNAEVQGKKQTIYVSLTNVSHLVLDETNSK